MTLSVDDLRRVTEILLSEVAARRSTLTLAADFYWDVPAEHRYDSYTEPTKLVLGQLSDDWSELQRILSGAADPLPYALVWLGAILRRIGEELEP